MYKPIKLVEESTLHAISTTTLAATGAVGALASAVGVAAAAGLFAAPALVTGILSLGALTLFPQLVNDHHQGFRILQATTFATLSLVAILTGVTLGILSTGLMITFIAAALLVSAAFAVLSLRAHYPDDEAIDRYVQNTSRTLRREQG